MTKKKAVEKDEEEDDAEDGDDEDLLDMVDESDMAEQETKKAARKKSSKKKSTMPAAKVTSGMEETLKTQRDAYQMMMMQKMNEQLAKSMTPQDQQEDTISPIMAIASNPTLFDGISPDMKAILMTSMMNPQMSQMAPLLMLMNKGGNTPVPGQPHQGGGMQDMLVLLEIMNKLRPQQPQQAPDQNNMMMQYMMRTLERQNQPRPQGPDPATAQTIAGMQQMIKDLTSQIQNMMMSQRTDPIKSIAELMPIINNFRGMGQSPTAGEIELAKFNAQLQAKQQAQNFEIQRQYIAEQSKSQQSAQTAGMIGQGLSSLLGNVIQPIANVLGNSVKEKMDTMAQPAMLPVPELQPEQLMNPPAPQPQQFAPFQPLPQAPPQPLSFLPTNPPPAQAPTPSPPPAPTPAYEDKGGIFPVRRRF